MAKFMFAALVTLLKDDIMTQVPSPAAEFVVFGAVGNVAPCQHISIY